MIQSKYYIPFVAIFTIAATYFLSWWAIPMGICLIAYLAKEVSGVKAMALATGITSGIWMAWAGMQEFSAVNKVSVLTGQIFGNQSSLLIYVLTGLTISIISGMAALLGSKLRQLMIQ
jgi:hypothetical protein